MTRHKEETKHRPDVILLIVTLLLLTVGTVMIYSSSSMIAMEKFSDGYYFLKKQMLFVCLGIVIMVVISKLPYTMWRDLAYPGIFFSIVLLILVVVPGLGTKVGGATRWLRLGGFSFQVSEVVKVALVLFMAHFLTKKIQHIKEFKKIYTVPLIVLGVVIALVMLQPDFGTSVIMVTVVMTMFFMAGSRIVYLAGLVSACVPVGIMLVIHESYRIKRWMSFRNPWSDPDGTGFQIIQSFISFGSGGTFGVGLGNSMQKLFYLPEPHTDFILSVIAEEGGFIGVGIVIVLFIILVCRGFVISFHSSDLFGTLLAAGLTIVIAVEAFINMAAVMGLIPTKGLALPFLSYGGTSLIISMVTVGILLNISTYQNACRKEKG